MMLMIAKIPWQTVGTIIEVLEDCVSEVRLYEIGPDGRPYGRNKEREEQSSLPLEVRKRKSRTYGGQVTKPIDPEWSLRVWPKLKPVFEKANGNPVKNTCGELKAVMKEIGRNPSGLSAIFTGLVRAGVVIRMNRGWYRLADGDRGS